MGFPCSEREGNGACLLPELAGSQYAAASRRPRNLGSFLKVSGFGHDGLNVGTYSTTKFCIITVILTLSVAIGMNLG